MEKITISTLKEMKRKSYKISMLTAYDYSTSNLLDKAGIDIILVGDSLGMVALGYENTLPVTMEEMLHHVKAVSRASKRALIVADMPFLSYQVSLEEAVKNAGRFIKEAGASAVKLEGGRDFEEVIKSIIKIGIPVMGHIGLTPQFIHQLGGYKVQGRDVEVAKRILEDAKILEEIGIFALILECIPDLLAKVITENLSIPTIGIGAGKYCDGQVLVFHDMLGLFQEFVPKHTKRYADLSSLILEALKRYKEEIKEGKFPEDSHSFKMNEEILKEALKDVAGYANY